ncbi:hypothetical protein BDV93DRAFT_499033 [Ceratobasidium sp. AG-I]|nr:hypothetical protein BDV93DRAFT_499033 [Ceratobasidium sp. AG-I]
MASTPARAKSGFRHRIQEISLSPTPSKHPIELELLIDGTPVYGLPAVAPGSPLRWSLASHPCDVQSDSKITLKIIEKHFPSQRNRVGYLEYLVCNVGETASIHLEAGNPTSQSLGFGSANKRWDHGGPFAVGLTFPDRDRVEDAYLVALNKADMMMESKKGPLEGLGRFRDMFKTLIDVGKLVAEMNSSAKLVVELCAMAWEHLEKLQQLHDDLRKLLEGLERILPFIDYVKEYAQNSLLGDTVTSLLNLIEDSSHFMLGYFSNSTTVRLLRSTFDGRAPDRVGELLQQFTDLKEDFDRSIRVQLLASVLTNAQRTLIDRLNLTTQSHYDHTPPCQTGTRQQILDDINQWLDDQNTTEKLLWLYGHAGQGKSSIAASVSRALNGQGTLGAHFFCKRDDPDLRSPERILNTIVHRLAMKYKAYGHAVSSAIDSNTELPNSSLQSRYSNLIEKPLQTLVLKKKERPGLLVVIVDALDECDKGDGRRSILAYLRGLSMLVPWIKVIVTSRPDQDIKLAFGKSKDSIICARNVHDYNASDDIYAYIHSQMTDIAAERDRADWPDETIQLLSQRADGLFIWAATACRFISDAVNVDQRLKQVLEGTESSGSSYRLDVLYTTAIRHSMDSEDQDNIEYTRQCIAVVVATASRTPLSVPALEALLGNKFGTGTLRRVVARLGSVLYEDEKKGDVVRAYHPSFADYATNPARSKEMYVATESINTTLAECCLAMMLRELRFNICGLETSHLLNHDIPNLCSRVQSAIRPHLEYSCLHWSSHLAGAPKGAQTSELGELLLGPVLLFWIEALSLMSKLGTALSSLQEITNNTSVCDSDVPGYARLLP